MMEPVIRRETRQLRYQFSESELNAIAERACESALKVLRLQDEKKSAMKHYADVIEAAQLEANQLARLRGARYEYRDVEVEITLVTRDGSPRPDQIKTVVRLDTGEILPDENLTDDDRQLALEMTPAPTDDAAPVEPAPVEPAPVDPAPTAAPEPAPEPGDDPAPTVAPANLNAAVTDIMNRRTRRSASDRV